jgi:hypothetical protein
MLRHRALLIASLGLVLVAVLAMVVLDRPFDRRPVYSVAQLHSHLEKEPRRWLGRTLLVRGKAMAAACVESAATAILCAPPRVFLTDPDPSLAVRPLLPLAAAGSDPWLTSVRRLPLIGRFAPPPQVIRWEQVAVYRVRLRSPAGTSGERGSYEALLVDALPGAG